MTIKKTLSLKYLIVVLLIMNLIAGQSGLDNHFSKIDSLLQLSYSRDNPGASVLVSEEFKTIIHKGYGLSNIELSTKVDTNTVFNIASISKQFTAMSILLLADENKLEIEDKLNKYVENLPENYEEITLENLLTHTSGIPNYSHLTEFDSLLIVDYYSMITEEFDISKVYNLVFKKELEFEQGTDFNYSNTGYQLLQDIIEIVTGESFASYIRKNIFSRLGMENSHFLSPTEIIRNRATGYTSDYKGKILNHPFLDWYNFELGSAGILSTTSDLYKWYKSLHYDIKLSKLADRYLFRPFELKDGSKSIYGMGFFVKKLKGYDIVTHNGDNPGYASCMLIIPDKNIYITILGNSDLYYSGSSRYHEIVAKRIAGILLDDPFPSFNEVNLDNSSLERYKGSYKFENNIIREVLVEENKIYTRREGGRKVQIYPFSENKFYYKNYLIYITFNYDEYGKVIMTMNYDDGRKTTGFMFN